LLQDQEKGAVKIKEMEDLVKRLETSNQGLTNKLSDLEGLKNQLKKELTETGQNLKVNMEKVASLEKQIKEKEEEIENK